MNLKSILVVLFLLPFVCLYSCKKDKSEEPKTVDYLHLQPGNYWIYEEFRVNEQTAEVTSTGAIDSVYVSDDFEYNGNVYKTRRVQYLSGPDRYNTYMEFYRDSMHYILDTLSWRGNHIFYAFDDFSSTLNQTYYLIYSSTGSILDTVAHVSITMADKDVLNTVPAGTFHTIACCYSYDMYPYYATHGKLRKAYTLLSADIGIIQYHRYLDCYSYYHYERRLIRYHVQ